MNAQGGAVAVGDAQTGAGLEAFSVEICTSADGVDWVGPMVIGVGVAPAAAIAPDGRIVVLWQGGPATSPDVEASARPPGGAFTAPVVVSSAPGHPAVAMDGSGNAIAAWAALNLAGAVQTASLPAGGSWTAAQTLDAHGGGANVAANASGAVVVTWIDRTRVVDAASGALLGGLGAPIDVGPAPQGYIAIPPAVAIDDGGVAVLAWETTNAGDQTSTRDAAGVWSAPRTLSTVESPITIMISGQRFVVTATDATGAVHAVVLPG